MTASRKWVPETAPPVKEEPGKFVIGQAERLLPARARRRIPEKAERAGAIALALGYGVAFGALYSLVRPRGGPVLTHGALLGIGTWATSYLGWLPATGLTPPVWKQKPVQVLSSIGSHTLFGVAVVGLYDWLEERVQPA
jgi:hypothetical protein